MTTPYNIHFSNRFILSCCLLFVCVSCSRTTPSGDNDTPFIETSISSNQLTTEELNALYCHLSDYPVQESEIEETANVIIDFLDRTTPQTKTGQRHISSISPVKNSSIGTKSDSEAPIAYIVNFSNDGGYAILSADHRTDDILTVSPTGNLNLDSLQQQLDSGDIPLTPLLLMSNIEAMLDSEIEEQQALEDSLVQSALQKLSGETTTKSGTDRISVERTTTIIDEAMQTYRTFEEWEAAAGSISPMVKTEWGQGAPFNNFTPRIDGKATWAGCVPVAMAQLMSYWQYPNDYDWASLNRYSSYRSMLYAPTSVQDEVARLLADIGSAMNVDYGIDGSSANTEDAVGYFKNLGFANPGTYEAYDESKILESLYDGQPVIVRGSDIVTTKYLKILFIKINIGKLYSGHCWLIDGTLAQKRTVKLMYEGRVLEQQTEYRNLLHCNFGWGRSSHDGYYLSYYFNTNAEPITRCIVEEKEGEEYNFKFDLHSINNIRAY